MARTSKKRKLPFDKRGGVVVICRHLLESPTYIGLNRESKALMTQLQLHWRHDKPIDYGIREAAERIPCSEKLAMRAFKELQDKGFIVMINESWFSSRTQSKSRTWRLTWMPWQGRYPTNEWEEYETPVSS